MAKKTTKRMSKTKKTVPIPVKEYAKLFLNIKELMETTQIRAITAASKELLNLYWAIGKIVHEKQEASGWGSKFIDQLSIDINNDFPGVEGFSRSNIFRMRAFYLDYSMSRTPVRQFADIANASILSNLPWSHNVILMEKVSSLEERLWYAQKAIENGWSRNILAIQIDSHLHKRQGKSITNFSRTLTAPHSDLATQALKDPYVIDFINLRDEYIEKEVEQGLINHIQRFLLELGQGFAFVGRQVPLEVDEQSYYIDLLFYHIKLGCYVVIELKTGSFNPRDAGQIGFYLAAVDAQLKAPNANPTIGLILCRNKRKLTVEYALRASTNPIAVSSYATSLVKSLPKNLKTKLPTIKEIEAGLEKNEILDKEIIKKKKNKKSSN